MKERKHQVPDGSILVSRNSTLSHAHNRKSNHHHHRHHRCHPVQRVALAALVHHPDQHHPIAEGKEVKATVVRVKRRKDRITSLLTNEQIVQSEVHPHPRVIVISNCIKEGKQKTPRNLTVIRAIIGRKTKNKQQLKAKRGSSLYSSPRSQNMFFQLNKFIHRKSF